MGKDAIFRGNYDVVAALRNAPKLLGMELRECGVNKLCGGYYLNGDLHPYRKDKTKVFASRGAVWVAEEGGRCVSLPQWLIEFGGAEDYKDALRMIKGQSQALVWNHEVRTKTAPQLRYVDREVLEGAKRYLLETCPLFRWMCKMFPEERVREAWDLYNVTTDSHGNCVYWYVNQDGKILYDKRICYDDGHRRKDFFPGRQFRVGDGYTGRCYFGACIPSDGRKTFIVESEKAALLGYLYYGRRFLATGGKGNLREVDSDMLLVPDMDARKWEEKGEVWPWWEKWGLPIEQIPEHADIGDMIEAKLCASGTVK